MTIRAAFVALAIMALQFLVLQSMGIEGGFVIAGLTFILTFLTVGLAYLIAPIIYVVVDEEEDNE